MEKEILEACPICNGEDEPKVREELKIEDTKKEKKKKESLAVCPRCNGNNVFGVTRVVGYFSRIENWVESKLGELIDRKQGNYDFVNIGEPFEIRYKEDGIYHLSKEGCPNCESQEKYAEMALNETGLAGKVNIYIRKMKENGKLVPKNLALAAKMGISISSPPGIGIVKDGRLAYRHSTVYEEGKPATLLIPKKFAEVLRGIYANQS